MPNFIPCKVNYVAFLLDILHFYYLISVNKNAKPITSQPSRPQPVKVVAVLSYQPSKRRLNVSSIISALNSKPLTSNQNE